jgi:hypothetical protein
VVFCGSDAGDVNLNLDHVGVNAIDGGTESLEKHDGGYYDTNSRFQPQWK